MEKEGSSGILKNSPCLAKSANSEGSESTEAFDCCGGAGVSGCRERAGWLVESGRPEDLGQLEGSKQPESLGRAASSGRLVVCPTPLGNLGDMTTRALDALRAADTVCAEDTRVTGKLLSAFGIEKRIERLDESIMAQRAAAIVRRVLEGETVVYCSDAGMPGVSDPGLRLVRDVRAAGGCVEVLPGPTAVATAYVASGSANPRFFFGGFFPRKPQARTDMLESLRTLDAALIFYESPNRLVSALEVLARLFPWREVTVCRELTKLHEEVVRGKTDFVYKIFLEREAAGAVKGEIVIVLDGPSEDEGAQLHATVQQRARMRAEELAADGVSGKRISQTISRELGISRNEAYEIALSVKGGR